MSDLTDMKKAGLRTQIAIETWHDLNANPDSSPSEIIDNVLKYQTKNFSAEELKSISGHLNSISLCAIGGQPRAFSRLLHIALNQETKSHNTLNSDTKKLFQDTIKARIGSEYIVEKVKE